VTAADYARDLFLRIAAIDPSHVDEIARLMVTSFQKAIDDRCEQCVRVADPMVRSLLEKAAGFAEAAADYDEINNGSAATGAAEGLASRIRELIPPTLS
jgi:hypothetical protein